MQRATAALKYVRKRRLTTSARRENERAREEPLQEPPQYLHMHGHEREKGSDGGDKEEVDTEEAFTPFPGGPYVAELLTGYKDM